MEYSISRTFNVEAYALRDAEDEQIFQKARQQGIVTNRRLQNLLIQVFPHAQELLVKGEAVVEITDLETTKK